MSMFILAISCLTTSNLPQSMDLISRFLWNIVLYNIRLTSIISNIHSWALSLLWLSLFILSGAISSLFTSSTLGTYLLVEFIFQCSVHLFASSYCSWGSQGKSTEVVCHSLLQLTTFCQTSPPWPTHLGWPHMAWLNFIELDKAVVCVIRLASFLWVWFQCVCHLMPSWNT